MKLKFIHYSKFAELSRDVIFPPCCIICADAGFTEGICGACWQNLNFIAGPVCNACGYAFHNSMLMQDQFCAGCLQNKPAYNIARAVFIYDNYSRRLIFTIKNRPRLHAVPVLARLCLKTGKDILAQSDCLIPVPLHWWRLLIRGYNQAELLATAIAKLSNKPIYAKAIKRVKHTPSLGKLGHKERHNIMKNVFKIRHQELANIQGKVCTIIDDVLTTGATAESISKCLLKNGAKKVNVLTLARVHLPRRVT